MFKGIFVEVWFVRFLAAMGIMSKITEVKALGAIVEKPTEWTKLGENVEIFCSAGNHPIGSCYWTKSSGGTKDVKEQRVKINAQNEIEERPTEGQYEFVHSKAKIGLEGGHCGLRIKNISSLQIGVWGCTLVSTGDDGPWIGIVDVPLLEKPSKPYIKEADIPELIDYGNGTVKKGNVVCCVNNGKPEEEIKFQIHFDTERIPDKYLQLVEYNDTKNIDNIRYSLCIKWDVQLSADDDGKELMCTITHRGYADEDERNAHTLIRVQGPPRFINRNKTTNSTSIAVSYSPQKELILEFFIRSNPKPDQIKISRSLIQTEQKILGSESEHFLKENEYLIEEIIQDLTSSYTVSIPEDHQGNGTQYIYYVTVNNKLGHERSEVTVIVSPPEGSDPGDTAWTLIIIAIVMAVIFAGIIVGVLYCSAKRRGWWCYKNRTQKYPVAKRTVKPKHSSNTGDTQHSLANSSNEYSFVSSRD